MDKTLLDYYSYDNTKDLITILEDSIQNEKERSKYLKQLAECMEEWPHKSKEQFHIINILTYLHQTIDYEIESKIENLTIFKNKVCFGFKKRKEITIEV